MGCSLLMEMGLRHLSSLGIGVGTRYTGIPATHVCMGWGLGPDFRKAVQKKQESKSGCTQVHAQVFRAELAHWSRN